MRIFLMTKQKKSKIFNFLYACVIDIFYFQKKKQKKKTIFQKNKGKYTKHQKRHAIDFFHQKP